MGVADFVRRAAYEYDTNGVETAISWAIADIRRSLKRRLNPGRVYWTVSHALESQPTEMSVGGATGVFDTTSRHDYVHVKKLAFETGIIADAVERCEPDDVFWDVGTKIGLYSWIVDDALPGGHVVAFEPNPVRADRWKRNRDLNDPDATLVPYALFDEAGEVEMSVGGLNPPDYDTDRFMADLRRGDDLIDSGEVPRPDVMKIDVEGAELNILHGLSTTLRDRPPRHIYIEVHHTKMPRFDTTPDELLDYMANFGYDATYIESDHPPGNTEHYRFDAP